MKFKKNGKQILEVLHKNIHTMKDDLKKENQIFEKEKAKKALQAIHELEINLRRLEQLLPHIVEDEVYWLTEDDLQDFGFFLQNTQ